MPTTDSFAFTGAIQTWVVPAGVTSIDVDIAAGAGGAASGVRAGGGRVQCTLAVTSGATLYLWVGAGGGASTSAALRPWYNAGQTEASGGRGGALSAIAVASSLSALSVLAIAGGGGGRGGQPSYAAGGAGGGLVGGDGADASTRGGGKGGTQSAGGAPGANSTPGGSGITPASAGYAYGGGWANHRPSFDRSAGSGGSGHFGGGGGAAQLGSASQPRAGGGGGSSWTNATMATSVVHTQGYQIGNGYIDITWGPPPVTAVGWVRGHAWG